MKNKKASEVFKNCPALPNQQNEEWWEELMERAKVWGDCAFIKGNHENDELNEFIKSLIANAEKRGKIEGLEMAYVIFAGNGDDDYSSFEEVNEAIKQLK